MRVLVLKEKLSYTGREINSLWAYKKFGIQEDSIIAFRGSCRVEKEHLIDLEDRLTGGNIISEDMLHFIVEHFDVGLREIYIRQRLLVSIAREVLQQESGLEIERRGDDLLYRGKKLSVSIAGTSPVSSKIHLGINVRHEVYAGLEDIGIENKAEELLERIARGYAEEVSDIERAMRKALPLGVER